MSALPDDALDRAREALDGKKLVVDAVEWLETYREAHGEGPMVVDSAWLSRHLGRSQEWWAERARNDDVQAWQDSPGAPWYFDRASCKRHLLALLNDRHTNSGGIGSRGPRRRKEAA